MQDDPNGGVGVCTYTQTHVRVRPLPDRDAPSSLLEEVFPHLAGIYFHLQRSSWTSSAAVLLTKVLYSRSGHL